MDFEGKEMRDELHRLYWEEGKSLREISKSLGIPYASLRELFEKLGLRTRSIKKAQKLKWKQRKERIKNEL